jgi:signal transduction histidine kinase
MNSQIHAASKCPKKKSHILKVSNFPEEADHNIKVKCDESLLTRWWIPFCVTSWIIFIAFEIGVGLDRMYDKNRQVLCPHSDKDYGEWYWRTNYACLGGFVLILCVLIMKLLQLKEGSKRVPLLVAINIVTMGTIATFLALCFEWGGVCIDVLGVASPAAIWGEWIACGPLLLFITVTIVDKPQLSRMDWFFMITFFLCLLAGFFIIIPQPYGAGVFWLLVACLTYLPILYLPWYDVDLNEDDCELKGRSFQLLAEGYAKRYNLIMWLTIILPLYTVNYMFALFGFINPAQTIVIYQILSVLTKGLFAAATMDIHLDMLYDAEKLLVEEQRANNARRNFMKYIFHEVRTPLNSLTMGIDLLSMSSEINEVDRDSLSMMRSASEFMSDTLNNVLSLQKIEEGKFELELSTFSLEQVVLRVFATFRGAVTKKNLSLSHKIFLTVPDVIGDVHKIEHVFSNLLSNAIKFSPEGASVRVEIVCDSREQSPDGGEIANVTVAVQDEGGGISQEDQAKLFNRLAFICMHMYIYM